MNLLKQVRNFKTPSSYYAFRGSRFKKRIFYTLIGGFGFVFYSQSYKTDLKFHFDPTPENREIIMNCKQLRQGVYKPTTYLFTPFLQALYGSNFDPTPYIRYSREYVPTPDGGQLALDFGPVHQKFENQSDDLRILVLCHGLTGASNTNYMTHAALNGYRFGFRTVTINVRGLNSEMKNNQWTDYTKTDDLETAIEYIRQKYPKARLYGLGISIGANWLVKYAGRKGEQCPLRGIALVANPWDVKQNEKELHKPTKRVYDYALARRFVRNLKQNLDQLHSLKFIDAEKVLNVTSVKDFDELFTRRIFKYDDMDDYYEHMSCYYDVPNVKIPALAIQSKDDPVCHEYMIPKDAIKQNKNFILVLTERGGHIEFFTGYKAVRWVFWPCMEYLDYIDKREDQIEMERGYDAKQQMLDKKAVSV